MTIVKTALEIAVMSEGGGKLFRVKEKLRAMIAPGAIPQDIDQEAERLIKEAGGQPSFKMVKDYKWTTCINVNSGVVHGIPTRKPLKSSDLVSVDLGMFYKGFHTDTSFTVPVGAPTDEIAGFLETGKEALGKAIKQAKFGNRISDISRAMQTVLEEHRYSPIRALTGHGIGRELHEDPQIPCFWNSSGDGELISEGAVLAIEVIYAMGKPDLVLGEDNWTISTKDGKMSALFEETVAIGPKGPVVLTA